MTAHPTPARSPLPEGASPPVFTLDVSRIDEMPAGSVVRRIPDRSECLLVLAEEGTEDWAPRAVEKLAAELAGGGRRVVVTDFDVEEPKLHRSFGVVGGRGLTDIVAHRCRFSEVAQKVPGAGFWFLPGGEYGLGAAEMVESGWWDSLLASLRDAEVLMLLYRSDPLEDPAAVASRSSGTLVLTERPGGHRHPGEVMAVVVGRHPAQQGRPAAREETGGLPVPAGDAELYRTTLESLVEDAREARSTQRELAGALVRLSETVAELAVRAPEGAPDVADRPPSSTPSVDDGPPEPTGAAEERGPPAGGSSPDRPPREPEDDAGPDAPEPDDARADAPDDAPAGAPIDAADDDPELPARLRRMKQLLEREKALVEQLRIRNVDLERRVARAESLLEELERRKPGYSERLEKKLRWRKRNKEWG